MATFPLVEGLPQSEVVFDTVFFITITSVLVQGTTIPTAARLLGVASPAVAASPPIADVVRRGAVTKGLVEMTITGTSPAIGRQVVEVGLPEGVLVVTLTREDDLIVPQGRTVLEPGDRLLVLVDPDTVDSVGELLGAERHDGP